MVDPVSSEAAQVVQGSADSAQAAEVSQRDFHFDIDESVDFG